MRPDTDVQLITDPKRKRMKTLRRKKTVKKEFGIKAFLRNFTSSNGTFFHFPNNSIYQFLLLERRKTRATAAAKTSTEKSNKTKDLNVRNKGAKSEKTTKIAKAIAPLATTH